MERRKGVGYDGTPEGVLLSEESLGVVHLMVFTSEGNVQCSCAT